MKDKKQGISLIVLIITIIIMIILAGAIVLTIIDDGPIDKANKLKFQNDLRVIQDEVSKYRADKLAENLGQYSEENFEGDEMVTVFPSTKSYIDKVKIVKGKVVLIGEALSESEKLWANEIGITEYPVIPNGFKYLEGTIDTGYVIINETDGNEFVWVPVEVPEGKNFEEVFIREEGYAGGHLQTMLSYCTEPLNYEGIEASESEIEEYNKMRASVRKYKGFYVARYEASDNGSGVAQSKPNQEVWNNIKWGNSMTDLTGGAVEISRSVYPEVNATEDGDAVSTLIYGVEWDALVKWLKTNYPGIEKDSSLYGNYDTDSLINTGSNDAYALNNIYDLAGNVWEWTMEASDNFERIHRGGYYYDTGFLYPISNRDGDGYPYNSDYFYGFRVALYVK